LLEFFQYVFSLVVIMSPLEQHLSGPSGNQIAQNIPPDSGMARNKN